MPNGLSGGFPIQRDTLRGLLDGLAADLQVGSIVQASPTPLEITVAQLRTLVDECGPVIGVEEQDHSWYVLHLQRAPDYLWVGVHFASPLLPVLRQQHEAWAAEHPLDQSWIAWIY